MPQYPLSLPKGIVSVSFEGRSSIATTRNPFSFQTFRQDWGGDGWSATVSVAIRTPEQIGEWRAFLLSLTNGRGSFLLHDPSYTGAKGFIAVDAVIDGGGQLGTSIDLRGMPENEICLCAGDYFEIANRLYTVLENVTADAQGACTVPIFPSLRDAPSDGTPLTFEYPKGRFRLRGAGKIVGLSQNLYRVGFSAEEDI